ncbi:MAG: hypothetical protein ABI165_09825 [Bryobacteraceae bacterium]
MWWWFPDLALGLSIVTLAYCLFVFDGFQALYRDSDTGWHIRTGESILNSRSLPRTDPYSFTRAGAPWLDWEWGSDVVTAAAHRIAGPAGVAVLFALAIATATWMWVRLTWAAGGSFLIACAMATPMLSTTNLHWLARPHIFSWLLLLAALWAAEAAPQRFRVPHALAIFLGSALWANLHGSFLLAPIIAGLYAIAHLLRPFIWQEDRALERSRARWFLYAALVSAAGTLVNPYGWRLHMHVIHYLSDAALLAHVGEFQSFNFHAAGSFQIMLTLALAAAGGVFALTQRKLAHFLLAVLFLALALRSARGLPLVALLLLPLANGAITQALRQATGLARGLDRARAAFLTYSDNLRAIDLRLSGAALAPLVILASLLLARIPAIAAHAGFPPDRFPVAAAAQVNRLPAGARILAPDKFGGYLIYRFDGRRKVFFDGRSDFYGAQFMRQYIRLLEVRPGWRRQLADFHFTHALLPDDYSLIPALQQLGWQVIYKDSVATLLQNPNASVPPVVQSGASERQRFRARAPSGHVRERSPVGRHTNKEPS